MMQQVRYRGLKWDNGLGFTRKVGFWTFSPHIGLNYVRNELQTEIATEEEGERNILGDGYYNDMLSSQLNLAPRLRIGWEREKWKLHANIPYNLYRYRADQQGIRVLENAVRSTFSSSGGMTYLINRNHTISSGVSGGNWYGGLQNFYNGYIISQYRSIQRYEGRLLGSTERSASVNYEYKNVLKATFANIGVRRE